ncbi:hypothetical protein DFR97_001433 [Clostridium beijerinckii]|uniref:hypothetical protein n=1 Tax=Clostridium beijerinckii TaxID=1520 RepID=UPI0020C61361|nr:hypothetical protein [Clostridium beijerinckii]NRZ85658.1 hypothetical protein [Clostridium beijerinckii]
MDILSNLDFSTAFKFLVPSLKAGLWVVVQATVFWIFFSNNLRIIYCNWTY